jgi:DNA repair photolyase
MQPTDKTRGTLEKPHNRYHPLHSESCPSDMIEDGVSEAIQPNSLVTECRPVRARTIIASNRSPDVPFNRSINPYQGCEHGCIYCYARPTHAYLDMSPGIDFETRLTYKSNAAELLQAELSRPRYCCEPITLGANTDPYQPVDRQFQITRSLLEVFQRCRHPVSVITKGAHITRDLDILSDLAADNLCSVAISITTLSSVLKRQMEPRAASAGARLSAMEQLSNAGVPVTLLYAPVIPVLNDHEMEKILAAASAMGAVDASYILLRLPLEVSELFQDWLRRHYPLKEKHIMSVLRQSRGGADNDPRFGHRMRGDGAFADLLGQRFRLASKKLGLRARERNTLRCDLFQPPPPPGASVAASKGPQIDLFQAPEG